MNVNQTGHKKGNELESDHKNWATSMAPPKTNKLLLKPMDVAEPFGGAVGVDVVDLVVDADGFGVEDGVGGAVLTPLTVPPARLVEGMPAIWLTTVELKVPFMLLRLKKPENASRGLIGSAGSRTLHCARMKYTLALGPMFALTVKLSAFVVTTLTFVEMLWRKVCVWGLPV